MRISRMLAAVLFAAGAVAVVEAQPGRQGGFGGGGVGTMVVSNKELQDELKITDAQKEKFKAVAEKQAEQRKKFGEMIRGGKDGFDKDKFAELKTDGEKVQAEVKNVLDDTLTTAQKKRLEQIERQVGGVRAFADEKVAADLKLTDTQKSKIKGISEEYAKDAKELRGGFGKGGFDKEKMAENQKKREKLTKNAMADVDEVLTSEQKKQWKELTGEPFDTAKLFQGFGGGRPNTTKGD